MLGSKSLVVSSPIHGVNRYNAREAQQVGREGEQQNTCWNALNILPFDRFGRNRVAQRPGIVKLIPQQLAASPVQGLVSAPSIVYPGGTYVITTGGLSTLSFPTTFVAGTYGPYLFPSDVPYPTIFVGNFVFGFQVTYALTGGMSANPDGDQATFVMYAPQASGVDLIFLIILNAANTNLPAVIASVTVDLYKGDVTQYVFGSPIPGGWLTLGHATSNTLTSLSGAMNFSASINSLGSKVTCTDNGDTHTVNPTQGAWPPTAPPPQINVFQVNVVDTAPSVLTAGVS